MYPMNPCKLFDQWTAIVVTVVIVVVFRMEFRGLRFRIVRGIYFRGF